MRESMIIEYAGKRYRRIGCHNPRAGEWFLSMNGAAILKASSHLSEDRQIFEEIPPASPDIEDIDDRIREIVREELSEADKPADEPTPETYADPGYYIGCLPRSGIRKRREFFYDLDSQELIIRRYALEQDAYADEIAPVPSMVWALLDDMLDEPDWLSSRDFAERIHATRPDVMRG